MTDKIFVDTNILVYAYDLDAGKKHDISKNHIFKLWENRNGLISTQVLQEFYVTLTRKIHSPIEKSLARRIMKNYFAWCVVINDPEIILTASDIEEAYRISFWDSLIVSAAFSKNADIILSEDFHHGQQIEGITVINPFL